MMPDATLLIVNREPQTIAGTLLDTHQFRIETLRRTETLVDEVHLLHPDIVLLGLVWPGGDSLSVCRQLKALDDGFLPVIMTGIHSSQEAVASFDAGADDMLLDPPHPGEIVARVRLMLRLKHQYEGLLLENRQLAERLILKNGQLENALQDVQQADRAIDNIVHNLAHELRTPLLQVKSAVSMMRSDGREGGVEFMDTLIGHATAATARLEDVVGNLGQLASAMQPQKREPCRVQDSVQTAMRQLGRKWSSSNEVGRVTVLPSDAPHILSDKGGVTQVLHQLIDNALKFSPAGGAVEVFAERLDQHVVIGVRDHGIGIPKEHFKRIFEPFYQVDSSPTRSFGGAGVGLAIVKMIIDGLGTHIRVESELGKGSTFSFVLPIADP